MSFLFKAAFSWGGSPRLFSPREPHPRLRSNTVIRLGRKLEIPRSTDPGYGKRSFQAAPLRAVFAPNRPLNDSAFPKSSGRTQ
jgi:hypothetical protein